MQRRHLVDGKRKETKWSIAGYEVYTWLNRLDLMEQKFCQGEKKLKKIREHLEAAKSFSLDITNPVEWHESRLA